MMVFVYLKDRGAASVDCLRRVFPNRGGAMPGETAGRTVCERRWETFLFPGYGVTPRGGCSTRAFQKSSD